MTTAPPLIRLSHHVKFSAVFVVVAVVVVVVVVVFDLFDCHLRHLFSRYQLPGATGSRRIYKRRIKHESRLFDVAVTTAPAAHLPIFIDANFQFIDRSNCRLHWLFDKAAVAIAVGGKLFILLERQFCLWMIFVMEESGVD